MAGYVWLKHEVTALKQSQSQQRDDGFKQIDAVRAEKDKEIQSLKNDKENGDKVVWQKIDALSSTMNQMMFSLGKIEGQLETVLKK